jgi:hypothetical protein
MIDGDDCGAISGMTGWEIEILGGNLPECRSMQDRSKILIDCGEL